mmetsp:Transcript_67258/g.194500  ORF Transcript_67258/g.194500 Transcript_67258/m.194500 type:complete len:227 (-) Transcript_67258:68-748(-)
MRESCMLSSFSVSGRELKTVGKVRANEDRTRQLMFVPAPVELNSAVDFTMPEAMNAMPMTSSKLERIEPIKDCCTTLTKPALIAFTVTIISTAFPKVALSNPPIICPVCEASASVAPPRTEASGTMAIKLHEKVARGPQSIFPEQMPKGTNTSSTLMGCTKTSFRPWICFWDQVSCWPGPEGISPLAASLLYVLSRRALPPSLGLNVFVVVRPGRRARESAMLWTA